ncbi:molybdenum ABC transporter permease [Sphingobacterium sp. SRCM116780]|uniref:molybdenum ABC transporter permease n=1 Tax=Sphingobacterium sp. SRCM116780 TaxID=2907623 RepID=UPI001F2C3B0A|nr:molybdenum ABC transporter permease [Sphingobacterium sp. SRCM116780]UIR57828.1 molybdenum ABC transporter permease [Sphingobacterium sp. SRCM116780]
METLVIAIIVLLPGIFLLFWISKRKFNRRNVAGIEGFSSYEKSLFVRFLERIGKWLAYILIILGILLLWTYSRQKKELDKNLKTEESI